MNDYRKFIDYRLISGDNRQISDKRAIIAVNLKSDFSTIFSPCGVHVCVVQGENLQCTRRAIYFLFRRKIACGDAQRVVP